MSKRDEWATLRTLAMQLAHMAKDWNWTFKEVRAKADEVLEAARKVKAK